MQACTPGSTVFVHCKPHHKYLSPPQISGIRSHARKITHERRRWSRNEFAHQENHSQSRQPVEAILQTDTASEEPEDKHVQEPKNVLTPRRSAQLGPESFDNITTALPWASSIHLDPLQILCPSLKDPELRRTWQEAVNVFWPVEQHVPMDGQEPFIWSFAKHCLGDALLFSCMSAALLSLHDSRNGTTENLPLVLRSQNRAIRLLKAEVAEQKPWRDELIFALLCMTPGEPDSELLADPRPYGGFTPMGTHLQYLKTNGLLRWSKPHKDALTFALRGRGGITTIKISGVAELMQGNDVVECSHTLSEPNYPLCSSYQTFLATEVCTLRVTTRRLSSSTLAIASTDCGPELHDLLWDMKGYIDMSTTYTCGSSVSLDMAHLATHRNLIQYRLLSGQLEDDTYPLNALVLLGAKIFSHGVIYPLPNRKPQLVLAALLRDALLMTHPDELNPEFLTWLLVLGGIATANLEAEVWFSTQLAQLYQHQISAESRSLRRKIMAMMRSYLWMDTACNQGFLELWSEVENAVQAGM